MTSRAVARIGVESPEAAIRLLVRAKDETGGAVVAFELMGRLGFVFALWIIAGTRDPVAEMVRWYVCSDFSCGEKGL
ncbi:MAG: FAD/FMN-containing dehydrogenase, partial [Phenylobacterium sp.]|nr:FAD/FMN-containing dehydrogenase [Phenylobacterium sp.]